MPGLNDVLKANIPTEKSFGIGVLGAGPETSQYLSGVATAPVMFDPVKKEALQDVLQGAWPTFANAAVQATLGELVGGTLQGAGAFASLITRAGEGIFGKEEAVQAPNGEAIELSNLWRFDNPLVQAGTDLQNYVNKEFPIYLDPSQTESSGRFTSSAYWGRMLPSVVSTASMLIPTMGAARLIAGATKLMKTGALTGDALKLVGSAAIARDIENVREAKGIYDSELKKGLDMGLSFEVADAVARQAAKTDYTLNWANYLMDLPQTALLLGSRMNLPNWAAKFGKSRFGRVMGDGYNLMSRTPGLMEGAHWATKAAYMALGFTRFGLIHGSEGIEEYWNYNSQKEGEREAKLLRGEELTGYDVLDDFYERSIRRASDSEALDNFLGGMMGSIIFQKAGDYIRDAGIKNGWLKDVAGSAAMKMKAVEAYSSDLGPIFNKAKPVEGSGEVTGLDTDDESTMIDKLFTSHMQTGTLDLLIKDLSDSRVVDNLAKTWKIEPELAMQKAVTLSKELKEMKDTYDYFTGWRLNPGQGEDQVNVAETYSFENRFQNIPRLNDGAGIQRVFGKKNADITEAEAIDQELDEGTARPFMHNLLKRNETEFLAMNLTLTRQRDIRKSRESKKIEAAIADAHSKAIGDTVDAGKAATTFAGMLPMSNQEAELLALASEYGFIEEEYKAMLGPDGKAKATIPMSAVELLKHRMGHISKAMKVLADDYNRNKDDMEEAKMLELMANDPKLSQSEALTKARKEIEDQLTEYRTSLGYKDVLDAFDNDVSKAIKVLKDKGMSGIRQGVLMQSKFIADHFNLAYARADIKESGRLTSYILNNPKKYLTELQDSFKAIELQKKERDIMIEEFKRRTSAGDKHYDDFFKKYYDQFTATDPQTGDRVYDEALIDGEIDSRTKVVEAAEKDPKFNTVSDPSMKGQIDYLFYAEMYASRDAAVKAKTDMYGTATKTTDSNFSLPSLDPNTNTGEFGGVKIEFDDAGYVSLDNGFMYYHTPNGKKIDLYAGTMHRRNVQTNNSAMVPLHLRESINPSSPEETKLALEIFGRVFGARILQTIDELETFRERFNLYKTDPNAFLSKVKTDQLSLIFDTEAEREAFEKASGVPAHSNNSFLAEMATRFGNLPNDYANRMMMQEDPSWLLNMTEPFNGVDKLPFSFPNGESKLANQLRSFFFTGGDITPNGQPGNRRLNVIADMVGINNPDALFLKTIDMGKKVLSKFPSVAEIKQNPQAVLDLIDQELAAMGTSIIKPSDNSSASTVATGGFAVDPEDLEDTTNAAVEEAVKSNPHEIPIERELSDNFVTISFEAPSGSVYETSNGTITYDKQHRPVLNRNNPFQWVLGVQAFADSPIRRGANVYFKLTRDTYANRFDGSTGRDIGIYDAASDTLIGYVPREWEMNRHRNNIDNKITSEEDKQRALTLIDNANNYYQNIRDSFKITLADGSVVWQESLKLTGVVASELDGAPPSHFGRLMSSESIAKQRVPLSLAEAIPAEQINTPNGIQFMAVNKSVLSVAKRDPNDPNKMMFVDVNPETYGIRSIKGVPEKYSGQVIAAVPTLNSTLVNGKPVRDRIPLHLNTKNVETEAVQFFDFMLDPLSHPDMLFEMANEKRKSRNIMELFTAADRTPAGYAKMVNEVFIEKNSDIFLQQMFKKIVFVHRTSKEKLPNRRLAFGFYQATEKQQPGLYMRLFVNGKETTFNWGLMVNNVLDRSSHRDPRADALIAEFKKALSNRPWRVNYAMLTNTDRSVLMNTPYRGFSNENGKLVYRQYNSYWDFLNAESILTATFAGTQYSSTHPVTKQPLSGVAYFHEPKVFVKLDRQPVKMSATEIIEKLTTLYPNQIKCA